ncbi:MAG: DUF1501 domain-containing protein [Vicinamibacterales bacterium]
MAHTHVSTRRDFLTLSARLAALGLGSLAAGHASTVHAADATLQNAVTDYKALVCVYLFGGNDGNNLIVPLAPAQYANYQAIRGGLALTGGELLSPIVDGAGNEYALHYGVPELHALYGAGQLAVVLNTGLLQQPLTRAQYLAGGAAPTNLFSHSDQTLQAQSGMPTTNGTGWGGRLLDLWGNTDTLSAVSLASPALFLNGYNAGGNAIPPNGTLSLNGMNFWPSNEAAVRKQMLEAILTQDGGNVIRAKANQAMADGLQLAAQLQSASGAANFPGFPGTALGTQLREVARLIALRSQQGPGRQVFFVALDGFDTHGGQDWQHWYLLSTLSQALSAFHTAVAGLGLGNKVTAFTQSEFGRTLQSNGGGSDHAWGSHHIVLGGAVQGGVYGQMPEMALGGPNDAGNRGVWIPTTSTAQFGATLGRWFGASEANLAWAFPTVEAFPTSNVGFMKPA